MTPVKEMSILQSDVANRVCAVVVTYNRKDLLHECVHALLAQTHRLAKILIVNNASTDTTADMIDAEFSEQVDPQIEMRVLPENIGGAGGFHEGMKQAAAEQFDWLWLMDDDTIAHSDALEKLFEARARFPENRQPDLLASKVVWTDNTLHPMNTQWVKSTPHQDIFLAAESGTFLLRSTTFVSLLVSRRLIERYGLPLADYFIAGDDVEYTARILRSELGVGVPASVVLHKTPGKSGTLEGPAWKFRYSVRNTIWMLLHSGAFSASEKTKLALRLIVSLGRYAHRTGYTIASARAITRGLMDGLTTQPSG